MHYHVLTSQTIITGLVSRMAIQCCMLTSGNLVCEKFERTVITILGILLKVIKEHLL
jgi:hypothetical protein